MGYGAAAVERAMTYQQVIMRALAGSLTRLQAADILGIDPRSLRRWRARYERDPVLGLLDRRHRRPSHRTAPRAEVQRILRLYRERYQGFNVRHFHQLVRRDHGVTLSYTLIKLALQAAGLVGKRRARGRHRRRREPRPCFGELLHLDGSPHAWLALCPGQRQTLLAILDDATKHLLYAQLWPAETTAAVMTALATVLRTHGLPAALYTDRAGWAFHTPTAGGPIARDHLTHVGRALARLGIDHIGAYSPQARGRGERLNRTLQGRLVNELRVAQVTTVAAANANLHDRFIPDYNTTFTHPPPSRPRPSCRSARSISIRSCVKRTCGSSPPTTPWTSRAGVCNLPSSPAAPPVPACALLSAGTSMAPSPVGRHPLVPPVPGPPGPGSRCRDPTRLGHAEQAVRSPPDRVLDASGDGGPPGRPR
jgi:hypothetical protein